MDTAILLYKPLINHSRPESGCIRTDSCFRFSSSSWTSSSENSCRSLLNLFTNMYIKETLYRKERKEKFQGVAPLVAIFE